MSHSRNFDQRLKTPQPHIVALIAEIDGIRGEFKSGLKMSPQAITSLKRSVLVTSTASSTRIEGSKMSDKEVEELMQNLAISKLSDRDAQEVQGYFETLQNVFDSYQTLPLREGVVASLHNELLKYSEKDELHKGKYKTKENMVGMPDFEGKVLKILFATTPAWQTPAEMAELVAWTYAALEESRFHPLLIIANFVVEFLSIHPFEDGNGRLSRILTNLLLLRAGYHFVQYVSHEQIIERRKEEYYLALHKSQETFKTKNDTIDPWLNFFFVVTKEQATKALVFLEEENMEDTLSPKQYEVWKYISSKKETSVSDIVSATGMVLGTARQALERLLALGKIKRIGRGPATRYVKKDTII